MVLVILVVVGAGLWWRSTFSEDTDDAQVNGHLIQISSRIAGQVIKVNVDENQFVEGGRPDCRARSAGFSGGGGECRGGPGERRGQCRSRAGERADHDDQHGIEPELCGRGCKRRARGREPSAAAVAGSAGTGGAGTGNNVKAQADLTRYKTAGCEGRDQQAAV